MSSLVHCARCRQASRCWGEMLALPKVPGHALQSRHRKELKLSACAGLRGRFCESDVEAERLDPSRESLRLDDRIVTALEGP